MIARLRSLLTGPWTPADIGKRPYLWLLTLNFFWWKYFLEPASARELALAVLTVVVFVPMYLAGFWRNQQRSILLILLTCLIGVLWAPHNFGAGTFFIFACGMCAGIRQPRHAYAAVAGVLALAVLASATTGPEWFGFLLPALFIGLPTGIGAVMESQVRRSRTDVLRKQEEIEHLATIAERERISRDLHDLLGHTLSLITLKAELAGKLATRDAQAALREIKDIETTARTALSEVRAAVTGYRQVGFAYELDTARASLAAANIQLAAQVQPFAFPPAAENVMSLALREAVTNIVRHARAATRCDVTLALEHGMVVLRVADDGGAADLKAIRAGNGLTGMHERVSALGGRLVVSGGRGLTLELTLPLGAAA